MFRYYSYFTTLKLYRDRLDLGINPDLSCYLMYRNKDPDKPALTPVKD